MNKTHYYRAPMKAGVIQTGMYCGSDLAETLEIARQLRGPWESAGWSTRADATAIVRCDEDATAYGGWRKIIVEIIPATPSV